jgi:hypothetical protein
VPDFCTPGELLVLGGNETAIPPELSSKYIKR